MAETEDGPRADDDGQVVSWLESALGGKVISWSRQPRWRPMWFLEVERGDERVRVCVRGERADTPLVFPLEHEMVFQSQLEDHGIAVPHVYGCCDRPAAFAMEAVPGRPDFAGVASAARARIVDEYLQVLGRMHQLPLSRFIDAGVIGGDDASSAALVGARRFEDLFRATKVRPDPLVEFVLGWLRRHPLPANDRLAPIVWDSGQFHHDGEHFVSIIDLELGHLGDPMMDLAAWRMRDTVIPFGDFTAIYRRYEEITGYAIDMAAIQWHHLFMTLTNQLSFHAPLARPQPVTDYMTYAQWVSETNLHAVETMAEYLGLALEDLEIPDPVSSPVSEAHAHLQRSLRSIRVDDPYVAYQIRIAFRLSRHVGRFDQIGPEVVDKDRADVAGLTGRAPAGWAECEAELERFVLADEGRHDEELVVLFNKRWRRYKALMGPPGSAMAEHHTMQPLGRSVLS